MREAVRMYSNGWMLASQMTGRTTKSLNCTMKEIIRTAAGMGGQVLPDITERDGAVIS